MRKYYDENFKEVEPSKSVYSIDFKNKQIELLDYPLDENADSSYPIVLFENIQELNEFIKVDEEQEAKADLRRKEGDNK